MNIFSSRSMRIFVGIPLFVLTLALAVPSKDVKVPMTLVQKAKCDSLAMLKVFLQVELKQNERVIHLKNKGLADSLTQGMCKLSDVQIQSLSKDSALTVEIKTQEKFKTYWKQVEAENGVSDMKAQHASRDVDQSRIPKIYLADSSIVILPGWIVIRKH